jgi:hypothetical protein
LVELEDDEDDEEDDEAIEDDEEDGEADEIEEEDWDGEVGGDIAIFIASVSKSSELYSTD